MTSVTVTEATFASCLIELGVVILLLGDAHSVTDRNRGDPDEATVDCVAFGCRCLATVDRTACNWCDVSGAHGFEFARQEERRNCDGKKLAIENHDDPNADPSCNNHPHPTSPVAALLCPDAGLTAFPAAFYGSNWSVIFVDLLRNAFDRLDADTVPLLHAPQTVVHLRLADNRIRTIDGASTFGRAPWRRTLRTLDLSGNWLSSVDRSTFSGLVWLTRLDLSSNRLERIDDGAFSSLTSLSRLDLSRNRLVEIRSATFDGLSSLGYLLLTGNEIGAVRRDTFLPLERLLYVVMRGNPIGQQMDNVQVCFRCANSRGSARKSVKQKYTIQKFTVFRGVCQDVRYVRGDLRSYFGHSSSFLGLELTQARINNAVLNYYSA